MSEPAPSQMDRREEDGWRWRVLLDGVPVERALRASVPGGWVEQVAPNALGIVAGEPVPVVRRWGRVEIRRVPPRESAFTEVYTDGGCIGANPSPIGGTWACCRVSAEGERTDEQSGILRPADYGLSVITNNVSELAALVWAVLALPEGWEGTVCSDSEISLIRLFRAGALNNVPERLVEDLRLARARLPRLRLRYRLLDGHPTREQLAAGVGKRGHPVSPHNVWCDRECTRLARLHGREDGPP